MTPPATHDLEHQEHYFEGQGRTRRIALGRTRCVDRHVAMTLDPLGLAPGARVLEIGCGMGRFTQILLDRGHLVTAVDLSPFLIDRLATKMHDADRLTAVAGRAQDVPTLAPGPFDAVVGFFFLHHLPDFAETFAAARSVLVPGGRIAFSEPNAFCPLVYLQVALTPGMSFKGEPSIPKMRPSVILPAMQATGFEDLRTAVYGMLPPFVSNTSVGAVVERGLEALPPLRPISAYRIFSGRAAKE